MRTAIVSKIDKLNIERLILIFFILQPFINMYKRFFGDTIQIGPFAIEEFFNFAYVSILFICVVIRIITGKHLKNNIPCIIYCIFIVVYLVLHCINALNFNTSIFPLSTINVFKEIYYIFRVYLIPIALMFVVWRSGVSSKTFFLIAKIVVLTISGVIVITNLLNISLVAYSLDNTFIKGNFFSWFTLNHSAPDFNWKLYTSKGWFYSTNQISALLFSLAPLTVYMAIKEARLRSTLLLCLQITAMVFIGTKTASWGIILVIAVFFAVAIFFHAVKLERISLRHIIPIFLVCVILWGALYMSSPRVRYEHLEPSAYHPEATVSSEEYLEHVISSEKNSDSASDEPTIEKTPAEILSDYLDEYAYNYYIQYEYLKVYPVTNDYDFWQHVISRDRTLNIDNRKFKCEMISRIIERNNNSGDHLLGIGYLSNVPYTERDYVYQYYIFGLVGLILLLGPFCLPVPYSIYKILRNIRKKLTLENCAIGMSLCCFLAIAYYSGHVFGMQINMLFLSLYTGKLLSNVQKEL